VLVLNLGFDRPSVRYKTEHWVYFPDKSLNFYRVGFYNNLLGTNDLNIYVEIGYPKNAAIDPEKELVETLDNLQRVGITTSDTKLVDKSVLIMDPAYVHISTKTDGELSHLFSELEKDNVYNIGRYGKWTYSSMEDCMIWAKELSSKLNRQ